MARRNPEATIVAMDISEDSLAAAQERIRSAGFRNVVFQQADVYSIAFAPDAFAHVFVCFSWNTYRGLAKPWRISAGSSSTVQEAGAWKLAHATNLVVVG